MDVMIPHEALIRIQMEYVEMPGLKLSPDQIGRLCSLPQDICEGALGLLLQTGFLARSRDGLLGRPSIGFTRRRSVIA